MFSARTSWPRSPNRITRILDSRRSSGLPVFDLTKANPTECSIPYPEQEIRDAISHADMLSYRPDPRGLYSARTAIADLERRRGVTVDTGRIFLTASTSEAYSLLFKLLCDPGESVLVPRPSYPLFDYLAQINDVSVQQYQLRYDGEWHIDLDSLKAAVSPASRAMVIVHPHNPTGMVLARAEYASVQRFAEQHGLALIVDEVFSEYPFGGTGGFLRSAAAPGMALTFTLDGISKMFGLPQMKLGWIIAGGPGDLVEEAAGRLEILLDTYLSVNTPVEAALPGLISAGMVIHERVLGRVLSNLRSLRELMEPASPVSMLNGSGGWYAVFRVPGTMTDEQWSVELLEKRGILLHPGYFFDFEGGAYLVASLLVEPEMLKNGITETLDHIRRNA